MTSFRQSQSYLYPDFHSECRICDTSPTVVVAGHEVPSTHLCGVCFFGDAQMSNVELWNDQVISSDSETE